MKTVNTEAKSMLAKLLAVENITVQHNNVPTAMFDVANRVLVLPMWENMNDNVYDLLVGHEVGHALFTPNTIIEAIESMKTNAPATVKKDYLNVVEDVRIEKLMQDKYPGLRKDFYRGYDWMMNADLFGVCDKDVNSLPLVDRVNIHFKMRGMVQVNFSDEEMIVVDQIANAGTFDQAIEATDAMLALESSRVSPSDEMSEGTESGEGTEGGGDSGAGVEGENTDDSGSGDNANNTDGDNNTDSTNDNGDSGDSTTNSNNDSGDTDGYGGGYDGGGNDVGSSSIGGSNDDVHVSNIPESITQSKLEDAVSKMSNYDENGNSVEYHDVPNFDSEDAIVGFNEISKMIEESVHSSIRGRYVGDFNEFIAESKKVVSKMIQQFEIKKAAEQSRREMNSKSGMLDLSKVINYKWSEDIFLTNTSVNDGKSHGVVIFLDWSGSMCPTMLQTIKQMLQIAMFCKKASIPFEVYAFTSNRHMVNQYLRGQDTKYSKMSCPMVLMNLLSTRAKNSEWNKMMFNCYYIGAVIQNNRYRYLPDSFTPNSTPLNNCIIFAKDLINKFKATTKCDIVTPIFLTDGDASDFRALPLFYDNFEYSKKYGINFGDGTSDMYDGRRGAMPETEVLIKWLSIATGCKVCGVSIVSKSRYKSLLVNSDDQNPPFIVSNSGGYSRRIVVCVENDNNIRDINDVKVGANSRVIANAMMSGFKNGQKSASVMVDIVDQVSSNIH